MKEIHGNLKDVVRIPEKYTGLLMASEGIIEKFLNCSEISRGSRSSGRERAQERLERKPHGVPEDCEQASSHPMLRLRLLGLVAVAVV